jgi:hypothetical protein
VSRNVSRTQTVNIIIQDSDRGREVGVSEVADWALFGEIADALSTEVGGSWVERLDGLDGRYWDLRIGDAVVTLHLQHYLGIKLFASMDAADQRGSELMLGRCAAFLSTYTPAGEADRQPDDTNTRP